MGNNGSKGRQALATGPAAGPAAGRGGNSGRRGQGGAAAMAATATAASAAYEGTSDLKTADVVMLQGNALDRIRRHNYQVCCAMHGRGSGSASGSGGGAPMHTYSEYAMVKEKTTTADRTRGGDDLYDVWLLKTNDTASTSDIGRKIPSDAEGYFVQLLDGNGRALRADPKDPNSSTKLRSVAIYRSQMRPVREMTQVDAAANTDNHLAQVKDYVCSACQSVSRELDAADLAGATMSRTDGVRRLSDEAVASMVETWAAELGRTTAASGTVEGVRYYLLRSTDPANNMLKVVLRADYDEIDGVNNFTLVRENHPVYVRLFMLEANGFAPTAEGLNIIDWTNEPAYVEVESTVNELYSRETFVSADANLYEPKDMAFLKPYLRELAANGFVMEIAPDIRKME